MIVLVANAESLSGVLLKYQYRFRRELFELVRVGTKEIVL